MDNIRTEATSAGLSKLDLDPNPFAQFEKWFQEAQAASPDLPHAMTLATATKTGVPSARIVMLRGFDERGFVFYTNYESQKGRELADNPNAALVFHWPDFGRQVRITGQVSKVSREESDSYFRSRPESSRLAAWASRQSEVIRSRQALENSFRHLVVEYQDQEIPLPPFWGGYRLSPNTLEFWQGRPNRLHDRLRFTRQPNGNWRVERLSP